MQRSPTVASSYSDSFMGKFIKIALDGIRIELYLCSETVPVEHAIALH